MTLTALRLRDGQLSIRCESSQIDESRPFTTADQAKLRAWAERYTAALSKKPRDASVDFDVIGREIYSWLDGGERWLERIRAKGIQPPWLFEITALNDTSTRPDERALLEAPWELLRDAHGPLAARLDVLFNPVRRIGERGEPKPPSENELSMIFMAAAPRGASTLLFEEEEAAILDATRRLPLDLVVEESGALARMAERMAEEAPVDILQLSCHGKAKPSPHLALEDERGRLHAVDPNTLTLELGTNLPAHLLFLSACETADPYGVVDTFAAQMVRRGVPAALGWGGSVRDTEATRFSAALYERLARKEPLDSAIAFVRASLVSTREQPLGPEAPEAFHLARLYLGPSGGGPLTRSSRRKSRRANVDRAFLNAKDSAVPVATQAEFVGRRRQLQAALREMAEPSGAGLLVHGMGHHGKSSLAARIAQRMPRHLPVVIFGSYDAASVLFAIDHQSNRPGVHAVTEKWRPIVSANAAELRVALSELLEGPCCDDAPILLVIDDAERLLDGALEGLHRVKPAFVDVLRSVIEAFDGADTASRLLLTSRYRFTLPHAGRDLAERLALVHLPPMSEIESSKQARAKERASEANARVDADRAGRCIRAARGNPGLQSLLFKSALSAPDACDRALDALERYHTDGSAPDDEETRAFLEGLLLNELLGLLTSAEHALLRDSCLFNLAVPLKVFADGDRLLALGLWDRYEDPFGSDEPAVLPNPLVRPRLRSALDEAARKAAARRWVRPLFLAWGGALGARSWDVNCELGRLALMGEDGMVAARCGGTLVQRLYNRSAYREAASLGLESLRLADEQREIPSLDLLRSTGQACVVTGKAAQAETLYARALTLVETAEKSSERIDPEAHAALLLAYGESLGRQGRLNDAQLQYERARELLSGDRFERERAVTMGKIADILHARGQLDDALRIRR